MGVEPPGWEAPPPAPPTGKEDKDRQRKDTVPRRASSAASSSADGPSPPASSTSGAHSPFSSPHPHHTQSTLISNSSSHSNTETKHPTLHSHGRLPSTPTSHPAPGLLTARISLYPSAMRVSPISNPVILNICFTSLVSINMASSSTRHDSSTGGITGSKSPTTTRKGWPCAGEKTWTADTGVGMYAEDGAILLANALVFVHLRCDWHRPPHPVATSSYATYVGILTYFLDTPAPQAPISVHRVALARKELGTDVGQWFGLNVAAGSIKTLVAAFPQCGLSVAIASDGVLYESRIHRLARRPHPDP